VTPRLQWRNFVETHKVILQGGGEHARVVLDCLLSSGREVLGLFDPKYSGELMGIPQKGNYNPDFEPQARAIVAIGNNALRKDVVRNTKHAFTNAVHPSVFASRFSSIGEGCMVLHGVIIQAQSSIGNHIILNTGARIDHDCAIQDYVHVAPAAVLCGNIWVGEGAFIGAGAIIIPGIKIGAWTTIGAGSVVTKDIPENAVAVGNPARVIKYKSH